MTAVRPIILHAVESFEAGVFHSIAQICNGLNEDFDFVILHGERPKTPGNFKAYFPARTKFVRWHVYRTLSLRVNVASIRQLRCIVQETKAVRVHAHSSIAGFLVRFAFLTTRGFVIYSPRGYSYLRKDIKWVFRAIFASTEWLLGHISNHVSVACGFDEMVQVRRIARNAACIPNGVDVDGIYLNKIDRINNVKLIVVDAGRISEQKNFSLFCSIAEKLYGDPYRFVWIGGEIEGSGYDKKKLPENVEVTGWLPHAEVLELLSSADVFMHTALWEGLSRSSLEAAASGLALLLPRANGSQELIQEKEKTGYLCRSEVEYIMRLKELQRNRSLAKRMGKNAQKLIARKYNSLVINEKWRKLYIGS